MNNIEVLDCTLRVGGYCNKWDSVELSQEYLHAINHSNIDIIEISFRNIQQDFFLDAFAYMTRFFDLYFSE